jgi:hypothetical protein
LTYRRDSRPGRRLGFAIGGLTAAALILVPAQAGAAGSGGVGMGGGVEAGGETTAPTTGMTTPGATAKLKRGFAIPPASAPRKVVRAIEAANEIVKTKPYCMGGGHARRKDRCYDCSGSVSYALHGGNFLSSPLPSGPLESWGSRGNGRWVSVFANSGHAYAVIAGLRWDTSMTAGNGPGWSKQMRSSRGYVARHPRGY